MSKLKTFSQALDGIEDGATVGLGGWIFNSQPMALVRELIRRNKRNLKLVPAPGSIAPDMLIGAGCVAETGCVFISFEQFGLAPHFRRAAEAGTVRIHELDGPAIAGGLRAAACDLPYGLIPDMCTDLPRVNPQTYQPVPRAPGERAMLKVPAIHLDVVLLHAQQADELGNVQYFGPVFFDVLMAQAAKKVIVSVDRIVPTELIRRDNHLTKLPSAFVHSVVEAPFGAHPTSSGGLYEADDTHLEEYVRASGGAEVIKVEGLEGDMIRGRPPLRDGNSSYFGALNCGKKSLSIDLKSEAAKPIIYQLAGLADVVVENFRPGVMARLGFDYASLSKHNPKLVYCSISGYGQSGPGATRAAYAPIIHAASGYDAANLSYQTEQEYPASTGIFVADILSGAYAFGAIQAALVHRERTGEGQAVDVSLMDSMLNLMVFECQEAQFPSPQKRPVYAPMKSKDGHVIIAPISQKNFEQMADAMQRPDLKADERFATNGGRVRHWTELMTIIEQWTEQRTGIEIESIMDAGSVPCSRFLTVADAMKDPQLAERGSLAEISDGAGTFLVPNAPFQFTTPTAAGPTVSGLGADDREILSELLGFSDERLDELRKQRVLPPRH